MRDMDYRRYNSPPAPPCLAVADEQPVAEKRRQPVAHLRALALETVVMFDKGRGDGIRAVADEQRARQHAGRKHLPFEGTLFPDCKKVAPRQTQCRKRRERLLRPVGKGRNEVVHPSSAARSRGRRYRIETAAAIGDSISPDDLGTPRAARAQLPTSVHIA